MSDREPGPLTRPPQRDVEPACGASLPSGLVCTLPAGHVEAGEPFHRDKRYPGEAWGSST